MTALKDLLGALFGVAVVTVGLACFWPQLLGARLGALHRRLVFSMDNAIAGSEGPRPPPAAVLFKGTAVTVLGGLVSLHFLARLL
jgi:hypothetical protein